MEDELNFPQEHLANSQKINANIGEFIKQNSICLNMPFCGDYKLVIQNGNISLPEDRKRISSYELLINYNNLLLYESKIIQIPANVKGTEYNKAKLRLLNLISRMKINEVAIIYMYCEIPGMPSIQQIYRVKLLNYIAT